MGQFALDLAKFAEKAGRNADLVVRKVGIDVLSSVVLKSPVDTGRFRANWNVALGSPDYGTSEAADKSGGGAIARGVAGLSGFSAGGVAYITNNLPYAQRLENGWSDQAPAGMVRITIAQFSDFIRDALATLP
jgi:hypothetical protein